MSGPVRTVDYVARVICRHFGRRGRKTECHCEPGARGCVADEMFGVAALGVVAGLRKAGALNDPDGMITPPVEAPRKGRRA